MNPEINANEEAVAVEATTQDTVIEEVMVTTPEKEDKYAEERARAREKREKRKAVEARMAPKNPIVAKFSDETESKVFQVAAIDKRTSKNNLFNVAAETKAEAIKKFNEYRKNSDSFYREVYPAKSARELDVFLK